MKKRIIAIITALLIVSCSLFAADALSLYRSFSDSLSNPEKAIGYYDSMKKEIEKETKKATKSLEKAMAARNTEKANAAYLKLRSLSSYDITKSQSDELLSSIIAAGSDADSIKWLYKNSRFYSPVLKLTYLSSQNGRHIAWSKTICQEPGSDVTLPSLTSDSDGVFLGWGVSDDAVTYEDGSIIAMPLTDQTLYAIFGSGVSFSDSRTGLEQMTAEVEDGQIVEVPALASDGSAIFAGWVDDSGSYLAPDDTEYKVEGNGTAFYALWKDVGFEGIHTLYYSEDSVPMNTQMERSFSLRNGGNENLNAIDVELYSDDDILIILKNHSFIPIFRAGASLDYRGFTFVAKEKGSYTIGLKAIDSEGDSWTSEFPVNVQ